MLEIHEKYVEEAEKSTWRVLIADEEEIGILTYSTSCSELVFISSWDENTVELKRPKGTNLDTLKRNIYVTYAQLNGLRVLDKFLWVGSASRTVIKV